MVTEPTIRCLLSAETVSGRVRELAQQIAADYQDRPTILIGVLKGSWVFLADLVRTLKLPVRCDFVKLSSYGNNTASTGQLQFQLDMTLPAEGQHLLVVEDIVDTGLSTAWLLDHLRQKNPASLRLCVLLDKPSRRQADVKIDYHGFTIADHFVVGYGIDCAERYRELPYVGYIER
jgi:hypoxanthine phosphoribosyltransferase